MLCENRTFSSRDRLCITMFLAVYFRLRSSECVGVGGGRVGVLFLFQTSLGGGFTWTGFRGEAEQIGNTQHLLQPDRGSQVGTLGPGWEKTNFPMCASPPTG